MTNSYLYRKSCSFLKYSNKKSKDCQNLNKKYHAAIGNVYWNKIRLPVLFKENKKATTIFQNNFDPEQIFMKNQTFFLHFFMENHKATIFYVESHDAATNFKRR